VIIVDAALLTVTRRSDIARKTGSAAKAGMVT